METLRHLVALTLVYFLVLPPAWAAGCKLSVTRNEGFGPVQPFGDVFAVRNPKNRNIWVVTAADVNMSSIPVGKIWTTLNNGGTLTKIVLPPITVGKTTYSNWLGMAPIFDAEGNAELAASVSTSNGLNNALLFVPFKVAPFALGTPVKITSSTSGFDNIKVIQVNKAVTPIQLIVTYIGTGGNGVWRTADGGSTWKRCNCGVVTSSGLYIAPKSEGGGPNVDVFTEDGTATQHTLTFMRSTDGGITWGPVNTVLTFIPPTTIPGLDLLGQNNPARFNWDPVSHSFLIDWEYLSAKNTSEVGSATFNPATGSVSNKQILFPSFSIAENYALADSAVGSTGTHYVTVEKMVGTNEVQGIAESFFDAFSDISVGLTSPWVPSPTSPRHSFWAEDFFSDYVEPFGFSNSPQGEELAVADLLESYKKTPSILSFTNPAPVGGTDPFTLSSTFPLPGALLGSVTLPPWLKWGGVMSNPQGLTVVAPAIGKSGIVTVTSPTPITSYTFMFATIVTGSSGTTGIVTAETTNSPGNCDADSAPIVSK